MKILILLMLAVVGIQTQATTKCHILAPATAYVDGSNTDNCDNSEPYCVVKAILSADRTTLNYEKACTNDCDTKDTLVFPEEFQDDAELIVYHCCDATTTSCNGNADIDFTGQKVGPICLECEALRSGTTDADKRCVKGDASLSESTICDLTSSKCGVKVTEESDSYKVERGCFITDDDDNDDLQKKEEGKKYCTDRNRCNGWDASLEEVDDNGNGGGNNAQAITVSVYLMMLSGLLLSYLN